MGQKDSFSEISPHVSNMLYTTWNNVLKLSDKNSSDSLLHVDLFTKATMLLVYFFFGGEWIISIFPGPMRSYIVKENHIGYAVRDPSIQRDTHILLL